MKIEHIAVYVNQLEEMKDFFVSFFDAVPNEDYYNPKTGFRSYFLMFAEGARLEIMYRPDLCDTQKHPLRTGYAHIAFRVGSKQKWTSLLSNFPGRDIQWLAVQGSPGTDTMKAVSWDQKKI